MLIGLVSVGAGFMMVIFRRQLRAIEERFYSQLPQWLATPYRSYNTFLYPLLVGALILLGVLGIVFSVF
ncbi:MAG: hypothetical protein WD379_08185 [Dehalococcoidia bacterium]